MLLFAVTLISRAQELVFVQGTVNPENDPKKAKKAASFEFMAFSQTEDLKQLNNELISRHSLGDEIARKLFLLDKAYTYEEPVAPGSSATKTMYTKSVIYNSVRKIERDLKKKVKSGEVAESLAVSELSQVLDVALNVVNQNTTLFEERLSSMNDATSLLEVYMQEVKLNRVN
jgi:hypothetical protein